MPKQCKLYSFLTFFNVLTTMLVAFHHKILNKKKNQMHGYLFFYIGPKRQVLTNLSFSSLSTTRICNAWLVQRVVFSRYFVDISPYCHCKTGSYDLKLCPDIHSDQVEKTRSYNTNYSQKLELTWKVPQGVYA